MRRLLLIAIVFFVFPVSLLRAEPITLSLTVDQLTRGRAVLSGSLDDTPGGIFISSVAGTHWRLMTIFGSFGLFSTASHISDPAPHTGETTPGANLNIFQTNLGALLPGAVGPQNASFSFMHPGLGSHFDILSSRIEDLNGSAPGYLGAANRISATFDMVHTPEPATLFLLGSGMVIAARMARKRRS